MANYRVLSSVILPLGRKQGEFVTGEELEAAAVGEQRAIDIGAVELVEEVPPKVEEPEADRAALATGTVPHTLVQDEVAAEQGADVRPKRK